MRSDKPSKLSGMTTRQKATGLVLIIVFLIIVWQVYGLFGGGGSSAPAVTKTTAGAAPEQVATTPTPKPSTLPQQQPINPMFVAIQQQEQLREVQYVAAVNELQLLKINQQIEETNQAIASAKLATITAEKNIVDLLTPAPPQVVPTPSYAGNLINPLPSSAPQPLPPKSTAPTTTEVPTANYTVISVTQLHGVWRAVVGYQGNLFQVQVGDVLPVDQSTVISIGKSGILLKKDNDTRKVSLVPII